MDSACSRGIDLTQKVSEKNHVGPVLAKVRRLPIWLSKYENGNYLTVLVQFCCLDFLLCGNVPRFGVKGLRPHGGTNEDPLLDTDTNDLKKQRCFDRLTVCHPMAKLNLPEQWFTMQHVTFLRKIWKRCTTVSPLLGIPISAPSSHLKSEENLG